MSLVKCRRKHQVNRRDETKCSYLFHIIFRWFGAVAHYPTTPAWHKISPTPLLQLPKSFPFSDLIYLFCFFFKSSLPSSVQRSSSGSKLRETCERTMCPMLVTSHHIWHHRDLIHAWLRPSLSDPESPNKAATKKKAPQSELSTKSSSLLTSAASLSLSLHTDCF